MMDSEEGDETIVGDNEFALGVPLLYALLEMVVFKPGMVGTKSDIWVVAVHGTLVDVGVEMIKDSVRVVMDVDKMLAGRGHLPLGKPTIRMMLAEACMMFHDLAFVDGVQIR
jgi:hypothetical protein